MERNTAAGVGPAASSYLLVIVLPLFLLLAGGCSISNSSDTLSDSISSPFDWSSGSSDSSSDGGSAYRQDVSDYTVAFASHSGTSDSGLDAFRAGLRQLAEQRGVVNWEEDALTCASIGLGLQRAGLADADAVVFGERLLGDDRAGLEALRAGYASIQ